jgi:two-component system, cell cycle sensor histidine kinase and response regulator CckA
MNTLPKILVVEDDRVNAAILGRQLPKLGFEVCALVATGEEAVAQATAQKPDLVLMDIGLTGDMDGIQAAALIRRQYDIPVVYLTANSDETTLARAKTSLPSNYLIKPFKERELQVAIEMALLNHGLNRELRAAQDHLEQRVAERTEELAQAVESLHQEIEVRRRAEDQAREQADLLAKARDAIYVRDLSGIIGFWNRSAERLYGILAEDAIGQRAQLVLGEENGASIGIAAEATLKDGEWMGEIQQLTQSGQELIVESRWTLVRDEFGAPKTILVVNTDVTDKKRIGEQFMRTQRLESIGALASGIAHDLNNVFAPILMATELMEGSCSAENERILGMVKTTTQRGAEMVKQVLMFVRGGSNDMEPVFLGNLAYEVRRLMAETLPCAIEVSAKVAKDVHTILGETTQLHQLLMNLCVNARDAMPHGGELKIEVDEVVVGAAQARNNPDAEPGAYVRLVVSDSGTGIPPEVRAKIFDPFFTTKEIGKGTGLGLSTVVSIVRAHNGFLELESEVGRGTRFLVYFPASDAVQAEAESKANDVPPGQGELIVVVDDEHSIREITRLTLEVHNYRVLLASDGAEALSVYLQHREEVALVVTDVMMPVMNGRALAHALRKFDAKLPILAFSAADRSDPLIGNLSDEDIPVLKKPASQRQLLVAVADAISQMADDEDLSELAKSCSTHFTI